MNELTIAILGVGGRMGRMLVQAVQAVEGCRLVAAAEAPTSPLLGRDAGEVAGIGSLGIPLVPLSAAVFAAAQVIIDFTTTATTLEWLPTAVAQGNALVIGTTGFNEEERQRIVGATAQIPIVLAPNYSVGVNLMFKVAAEVAQILGESFDVEIIEAHHRHKVDAPSGTALRLGEAIATALDGSLAQNGLFARQGMVGPRQAGQIGFAVVRGGDIVGDHTALFAGEGERFEITHRASSRMTFAKGAVRAALWVADRSPGLYDMQDILGLR